jgi:hypothetical protein
MGLYWVFSALVYNSVGELVRTVSVWGRVCKFVYQWMSEGFHHDSQRPVRKYQNPNSLNERGELGGVLDQPCKASSRDARLPIQGKQRRRRDSREIPNPDGIAPISS